MLFPSENVADAYMLNQWMKALPQGDDQRAIEIEFQPYNQRVKPAEDASQWDKWPADTIAFREGITGEFDQNFPDRAPPHQVRHYLIMHHNFLGLGHETQLALNLDYLRQHLAALKFEVAYLFGGSREDYLESFPWGGGEMSLLSLEKEIPYLILETSPNRIVDVYNFLDVIAQSCSGRLQFSFCDGLATLASRLEELATYAEPRRVLGKASSQAINVYQPSDVDA